MTRRRRIVRYDEPDEVHFWRPSADIQCARCSATWPAPQLTERMSEEDAARFIRGLGCPRCWARPALQEQPPLPGQRDRFLGDLLRLQRVLDCGRTTLLDALAELGGRP